MSDVIITDPGDSPADDSAHAAAVAEGMTQAHAANAELASSEAKAAAEAASSALETQAAIAQEAVSAAETAQSAASETQATSDAMYELMQQQNATLQAMAAKLLAEPEPVPEPEPEPEPTPEPDQPPAKKEHWYYRKVKKSLCISTSVSSS